MNVYKLKSLWHIDDVTFVCLPNMHRALFPENSSLYYFVSYLLSIMSRWHDIYRLYIFTWFELYKEWEVRGSNLPTLSTDLPLTALLLQVIAELFTFWYLHSFKCSEIGQFFSTFYFFYLSSWLALPPSHYVLLRISESWSDAVSLSHIPRSYVCEQCFRESPALIRNTQHTCDYGLCDRDIQHLTSRHWSYAFGRVH